MANLLALKVKRYRSFESLATFHTASQINVITGAVGAGKTSLLEMIYLLSKRYTATSNPLVDIWSWRTGIEPPQPFPAWAFNECPNNVSLEGTFASLEQSETLRLEIEQIKMDCRKCSKVVGWVYAQDRYGGKFLMESSFKVENASFCPTWTVEEIANGYTATLFIHSKILLDDFLRQAWSRSAMGNERRSAGLRPVLDPLTYFLSRRVNSEITACRYNETSQIIELQCGNKFYHPSRFGTAAEFAIMIAVGCVVACGGDILLIDDFGSRVGAPAIAPLCELLARLSQTFATQIFLVTNSNLAIHALAASELAYDRPDWMSAHVLLASKYPCRVRSYSAETLRTLFKAVDMDIRFVDK